MSAPLFVMTGAAPRLPNVSPSSDVAYDPVLQLLVHADGPVVDAHGQVVQMASTRIQTWCRDPHDSTYKLKDDTDSISD